MPGLGDFVPLVIDYMALIEPKLNELSKVDELYAGKARYQLDSINRLNGDLKRITALGDSPLSEQDNARALSCIQQMREAQGIIRCLFDEHRMFVPVYF